ncbi:MAG: symmetrical bis(5'-nucleosyl)-tetraphosphatase [Gammaproteobacteria bacterium]|nr:symmetrical bis(5'-nucleosyl)-tetraphosphatase [Gammaproteobacteria bacterium]MBI5615409.1 symmetrical bis(5'-nucleosyl)-tetraphosphatase [Gammaproteobacteria bacterium]
MATYAIGDLQGCYDELQALLVACGFDERRDTLWFVGDLVNRGPASLEVLRFVRALGDRAVVVLGNHDLHLVACTMVPNARPKARDTLDAVLEAPDRKELVDWLRTRPLAHHDATLGFLMVHAGVVPQWSVEQTLACAREVEAVVGGADCRPFLERMYGDGPARWDDALRGVQRLRFIVNCLTRLRYCSRDGEIDLKAKGAPGSQPARLLPWYALPTRATRTVDVVFGHWSTLRLSAAEETAHRVHALDTGAVWGGALTALRLEDRTTFQVPSRTAVPIEGE